jgi:hypothetical protein
MTQAVSVHRSLGRDLSGKHLRKAVAVTSCCFHLLIEMDASWTLAVVFLASSKALLLEYVLTG